MNTNVTVALRAKRSRDKLDDANCCTSDLTLNSSRSGEDTSSLEDFSPLGILRKGWRPRFFEEDVTPFMAGALPPLHPHPNPQMTLSALRRSRSLSSETSVSMGSSIVSVDAGKHGFITHDDASTSGSLVLAYEQGREIPPAEFDLPNTILGVYEATAADANPEVTRDSMTYSITSEHDFHKLPYQIRSKLNLSQADREKETNDTEGWGRKPQLDVGYGAIEESQVEGGQISNTCNASINTLRYSSGTNSYSDTGIPLINNDIIHSNETQDMFFPISYQTTEPLYSLSPKRTEVYQLQSSSIYLSMLVILVSFVGIVYGVFFLMKFLA